MAHVDDLTFINAAQILGSDNLYLGRPSDTADPDKRTDLDELISRIIGPVTTNANGSYIRLSNGFQLCWKVHTLASSVTLSTANLNGTGYRSGQQDPLLPAPFGSPVRTMPFPGASGQGFWLASGGPSATKFQFNMYSMTQITLDPGVSMVLLAIGEAP